MTWLCRTFSHRPERVYSETSESSRDANGSETSRHEKRYEGTACARCGAWIHRRDDRLELIGTHEAESNWRFVRDPAA